MNIVGRRELVRSVLTAIPIFSLTTIQTNAGFLKDIDKIHRKFLWAQEDTLTGDKSKVNWHSVCSPVDLGGLGIHDSEKFARALRLRWLWLSWTEPNRPWVGSTLPYDERDRDLFAAATTVTIENGETASFWESTWLGPLPLRALAPSLFLRSRAKARMVKDALQDHRWIRDIRRPPLSDENIADFRRLWNLVRAASINLNSGASDSITWKTTPSGAYYVAAAYKLQFVGRIDSPFPDMFWQAWAPLAANSLYGCSC